MANDQDAAAGRPAEVHLPPPPAGASPAAVKRLREMTGLPMMVCRAAAAAAGNDVAAAVAALRKQFPVRFVMDGDR